MPGKGALLSSRMTPNRVTTQSPYQLQMWPAHLLLVAGCAVAVLTVLYPSATRQYVWPWAPLLALIWLAPVAAVLGRLAFRDAWTWPNFLLCSGLALLVASTLLSAVFSPFAEHSLLRIWPTFAGAAFFFWLYDWLVESASFTRIRSALLARGISIGGGLLAVISVVGWTWRQGDFSGTGRNDFPFGHSIYNAGAMVLILPWLVFASCKTKGVQRMGWIGATAVALVALFSTSSRGGVIAAGVVCVVAATSIIVRAGWSLKTKAAVVVIATAIVVAAIWTNPRLRELTRGQGWSAASQESNVQRSAMIEAGVKLGAARPLLGWGPGTIPLAYPQVRRLLNGGVDSVLQLHNTPAQLWATLGVGGIVALLLLIAAFVRQLWRVACQSSHSSCVLASAASLLGYGLFTLTDHQLDVPAMNALLAVNLALFFSHGQPARPNSVSRVIKWRFSLTLIIVLFVPLWLTGRDLFARFAYEQSLILFDAGRVAEGHEYLESAAQRAPYDPYYRHQAAGRLLTQRTQTTDVTERNRLTTQAVAELERSLAAGCLQEFAHFNLGWLMLETGEPARAIPHFLATVEEAPHRGGAYLGLGFALQGAGHDAAAVRAYALEWINDPSTFTAPLWAWPDFAPLRPKIRQEADALLAEFVRDRAIPRYLSELWRWWDEGTQIPTDGFNAETKQFVLTLTALAQSPHLSSATATYPWGALLEAWTKSSDSHAFLPLTHFDEAFAAALSHRAARHAPPDWHGFLTAGLENEPALQIETRFSRSGYGVLALHPDGPVLTNLYVLQQNRLVATFAFGLFPPKGWLQARELLKRLPPVPATP